MFKFNKNGGIRQIQGAKGILNNKLGPRATYEFQEKEKRVSLHKSRSNF